MVDLNSSQKTIQEANNTGSFSLMSKMAGSFQQQMEVKNKEAFFGQRAEVNGQNKEEKI
jgi:hypothetical protein